MEHVVSFESSHPPVRLPALANLSEHLTPANSPVLFGCRTGICGTCTSRVEVQGAGSLEAPSPDERQTLLLFVNEPKARLLCQLRLTADIRVRPLVP